MVIGFKFYKIPHGFMGWQPLEISDTLQSKWQEICELELNLGIEQLSTGQYSYTLEHNEGDFSIEISENFNRETIEAMINSFDKINFDTWLRGMTNDPS